jgi:hypothetical protein
MARAIRYIMIGGFLGAGKTTLLAQLARNYRQQGKNVGIVTNDQAADLVDTNNLRAQGYDVGEVAGACFCCRFDDLIGTMQKLGENLQPDIILAEPVGSCTDLVATVIQPIKQLYQAEFTLAPYCVILKPSHGLKILKNQQNSGFSPKAEYILRKQLEEADAILVNRIDELSPEQQSEIEVLLKRDFPQTPVIKISALTGTGIPALTEYLGLEGDFGRKILDIDYDIYAEGEAELGWLNTSLKFVSPRSFALDDCLMAIVDKLQSELKLQGLEPAHLKVIGLWEGFFGVANLISSDASVQLSLPSHQQVKDFDLIVNARVACDPAQLQTIVDIVLKQVAQERQAQLLEQQTQSFRPGRPTPTHRVQTSI